MCSVGKFQLIKSSFLTELLVHPAKQCVWVVCRVIWFVVQAMNLGRLIGLEGCQLLVSWEKLKSS